MVFRENPDGQTPTTPNLVNKQDRLHHTHNLTQIDNVLTKQPPTDPNFVTLRDDFQTFRNVELSQNGCPLENDKNKWKFCARFFETPTSQFSRYEIPQKDTTTKLSTRASWILHHLKPQRQLNNIDKQDLMSRIYEQLNKTEPTFSRSDKENMIELLKKRLDGKAVEPMKTRNPILSLIALLNKGTETTKWFTFFMEFYKNGIIYTSHILLKQPLVSGFIPPTKKKKRRHQPEK